MMRILFTLSDLYQTIGGGQTVARKIIEQSPDLEFTYFRVREPADTPRPFNCRTVPLAPQLNLLPNTPPPHPNYEVRALEAANAIARSVAGQSFDIVEFPDYMTIGWALPAACDYHGVKVGRFVLSMHGNLSKSVDLNWGSSGDRTLELQLLERRQFENADAAYGISERYIKEWQSRVDRDVTYIDPLHFVFAEPPNEPWEPAGKPSLYCIGRSERRKGNDLFIELCRWLNVDTFQQGAHIGSIDMSNGIFSDYHLKQMAASRGIDVSYIASKTPEQLAALYRTPAVVILPTRYDTLNLVALEAVFSGCPIAVSSETGVCDYLDTHHPGIPYLKLDLNDFYVSVEATNSLLSHYDTRRSALHNALLNRPISLEPMSMEDLYASFIATDVKRIRHKRACSKDIRGKGTNNTNQTLLYQEDTLSLSRRSIQLARRFAPSQIKNLFRPLIDAPRLSLVRLMERTGHFGDARYFSYLLDAQWVPHRLRDVGLRPEHSLNALKEKLGTLYYYVSSPLYRCNFWLDIARVERLRGQDLMAATYELRVLRLLGRDPIGLLPRLTKTLEEKGFAQEAAAAQALYMDPASAPETVYSLLKHRFEDLRHYELKKWASIDDRRNNTPKVSVIVSLYKAEPKLRTFLTALSQQTLIAKGLVEIILVDSGSPTDERRIFEAFHASNTLDMVYARSAERETIQAAWNRGIGLARAPYLVFLGVDETLYPEALDVLAATLDRNPDTDWVMGNSLVTAVEESGLYKNDIMAYDRNDAIKDHVYLETCYLSWVAGMYRRSIHDRFGYYDETFHGAGDTEFKNRILPHINVRFIDTMLGVFLNYPDGQTTASPMAEIEDSRAWYLFRSAGGVRYAFEDRPLKDAEDLLKLCLGYRKSYCRHLSTDIEYAALLADYILSQESRSEIARPLYPGLQDLLLTLRTLEFAPRSPSRLEALQTMLNAWRVARNMKAHHASLLADHGGPEPQYQLMNDNRYEQHSWLWRSI